MQFRPDHQFLVLQWNARSLRANLPDLLHTLSHTHPAVIAIQETWLKPQDNVTIPQYLHLRLDRPSRTGGGIAFFYLPSTHAHPIPTPNPSDEILCLQLTKPHRLRLINVYHPPGPLAAPTLHAITHLISGPTLVVGDFNAHHPSWGNHRADANGTLLFEWASDLSLSCLNDGSPTFFSHGCSSAPDLTLASPALLPYVSWHPYPHLLGSDHYPLFTTVAGPSPRPLVRLPPPPPPHWPTFTASFSSHYLPPPVPSVSALSECLVSAIITTTSQSRPSPRHAPYSSRLPWWSAACARAIRDRNQALYRARRSFRDEDWLIYKLFQAQARCTLRHCKMEYWHNICSNFNIHDNLHKLYCIINMTRSRKRNFTISYLRHEEAHLTDSQAIANTFASSFASITFLPYHPPSPSMPHPSPSTPHP